MLEKFKANKKRNILLIIIFLLIVTLSITFAYYITGVGGRAETEIKGDTFLAEQLEFTSGTPISIVSSDDNFNPTTGSLSGTTTATVTLHPGDDTALMSRGYAAYFEITNNEYVYTTVEETPEMVLTILDPEGNEVTDIPGLEHVSVFDFKTNTNITGFDITTVTGKYFVGYDMLVLNDLENSVSETWDITITFVNLDSVQNSNAQRTLNSKFTFNEYYDFTGNYQTFTAPYTGTYNIELWGAQGGKHLFNALDEAGSDNFFGAYTSGNINLLKGDTVYLYVGGKGADAVVGQMVSGGYNGGGQGSHDFGDDEAAGGGGGATDIRYFTNSNLELEDLYWNSELGLNSRIMVAAGAGGSSRIPANFTSYGGGLLGYSSTANKTSQTNGYEFGLGQNATSGCPGSQGCGGGGGGYYGGFLTSLSSYNGGGSGSSFISGHTGSVAITSESDQSAKSILQDTENFPVRYIEVGSNGNSTNGYGGYNQIVELQAYLSDGTNVALNKSVEGNVISVSGDSKPLEMITNGDITLSNFSRHGQIINVDLEDEYHLDEIKLWRYFDGRTYYETYVKVYNEDKTKSKFLHHYEIDGTYAETSDGKSMSLDSINTNLCVTGNMHNACSVHYSNKVFTDTKMIDGSGYLWTHTKESQENMKTPLGSYYDIGEGHSGNGAAKITHIP